MTLSFKTVSYVSPVVPVLANYQLPRASSCRGSITTEKESEREAKSGCPGLLCWFYRAWGLSSPQLAPQPASRTGPGPQSPPSVFPFEVLNLWSCSDWQKVLPFSSTCVSLGTQNVTSDICFLSSHPISPSVYLVKSVSLRSNSLDLLLFRYLPGV